MIEFGFNLLVIIIVILITGIILIYGNRDKIESERKSLKQQLDVLENFWVDRLDTLIDCRREILRSQDVDRISKYNGKLNTLIHLQPSYFTTNLSLNKLIIVIDDMFEKDEFKDYYINRDDYMIEIKEYK